MSTANIILLIAAVLTGLIAGLFYAWSCSVMPGFARLNDREFVSVMRQTNKAIQNPVFFAAFFGAPIFLMISSYLHYGTARFPFLLAACLIYLTGTFGVTIFGNVPLNNVLDRFEPHTAAEEQITRARTGFERPWNRLNTIRTVSSAIAVILVIVGCLS
jgi:uncharacterized membrane protein